MIPVKIITPEEAKAKGLTSDKKMPIGDGIAGAMVVMKKNKEGPDELVEKYVMKTNKEMELKFMHKDRVKYLKRNKGNFEKYMNQFKTINGVDKDKFIKNNNLIVEDKDIK